MNATLRYSEMLRSAPAADTVVVAVESMWVRWEDRESPERNVATDEVRRRRRDAHARIREATVSARWCRRRRHDGGRGEVIGGPGPGVTGHGAMIWSGQQSVNRLQLRPCSDWSIESLHRALIETQSARYVQT